jgi:hypothetical protein
MRVFVCACESKSFFQHIKIQEREGVRAWDLDREKKKIEKRKEKASTRERERVCISLCEICGFFYSSNGWLIKK